MKRLEWIRANRLPQTVEFLFEQENLQIDCKELFEVFVNADPSQNKSALQWLMETYCRKGFLYEDIQAGSTSKVWETLKLFSFFSKNLPEKERNIYRYRTLASLYSSIQPYVLEHIENQQAKLDPVGRELKRQEKQKALEETYTLYENSELKIVIPLTEQASKWWGKGTRWCTAAENDNRFNDYNEKAPLFVILFQDHEDKPRKLQLWVKDNEIQWMDETDAGIKENFIGENYNKLENIILYCLRTYGYFLKNIPENLRTRELCSIACEQNAEALKYVPDEFKTKELCSNAVKKEGATLEWVPDKFKTQELCTIACQQNGLAIWYVPKQLIDKELCQLAVRNYGHALSRVPDEFKTQELCQIAVEKTGMALFNVPAKLKTKKLCQQAVEQDGEAIWYVPEKLISVEFYTAAIKHSGWILSSIPEQFKTQELCLLAVQQYGPILWNIPIEFKTKELCTIACQQAGKALDFVPKEWITQELCSIACQSDPLAIMYVPESLKSFELCCEIVNKDYSVLKYIPKEIQNREDFELILSQSNQQSKIKQTWELKDIINLFDLINQELKVQTKLDLK